jgi:hypothetical protein
MRLQLTQTFMPDGDIMVACGHVQDFGIPVIISHAKVRMC